mmetsp:Transcript_9273/g.19840  ORF Transcript_9273/g.19840 Transcript_9273/m.19840 type:complete len:635 (+) Transcript_9273:282-2186(+)
MNSQSHQQGNNSSLPPRPAGRLRTSRSLPVVSTSESSGTAAGRRDSASGQSGAVADDEDSTVQNTAAAAAAGSSPQRRQTPPGLPYDDSISSTSMTTFDSDDCSSSSWADTPESEVGYRIRPYDGDGAEEADIDDGDGDGGIKGARRQLHLDDEKDLPTEASTSPEPAAAVAMSGVSSHFAPHRDRNRRRRREQVEGESTISRGIMQAQQQPKMVRRISSDTFDNATIGKGAKRIISRGRSSGRNGRMLTGGLFDESEMSWPITTPQLLHVAKATLFALWLLLSMAAVIHLHWFEDVGHGGGVHLGGGAGSATRHLPPIAGLDGPLSRKGRIRGGPIVPILPHLPMAPRTHIPLPLPPNKASVVLMNYSRPRMVQESTLMRTLLSHPNVDEVILLHSNPNTAFHFVHPKVVNVDSTQQNDEMGLSLRFYFCQLAKNPWVIHVDDDMEFALGTLSELFIEFARNPRRIVGRFGRDTVGDESSNFFNGYSSRSTHKQTEVVLTKLMMMERDACGAFFEFSHLIWEDTVLNNGEGPLWNGEDIFMSLVANHVYGHDAQQANYAMDWLEVYSAPDSLKDYDNGKLDISGGMTGYRLWDWHWWQSLLRRNRHYAYRGKLWNTARRRLAESGEYAPKKEL